METLFPFMTQSSGIGGAIKKNIEDFFVEELPAYPTSGEGEHLFVLVEKRDMGTPDLVRYISRVLDIPQNEIGFAGRKDRWAVTRQYVSFLAAQCPDPSVLNSDFVKVLDARRHKNKLKIGHLKGNRFRILVRDTVEGAAEIATELAQQIARCGVPNYFGDQRFGVTNQTDSDGFKLLRGEKTEKRLIGDALRFALSAVQSRLFNDWVRERLEDGLSQTVMTGDVMQVVESNGCFTVEDLVIEQARFETRETTITGPMFGPQMKAPQAEPAAREARVLERFGMTPASFQRYSKLTAGTRRPMLLWPEELAVEVVEGGLEFRFALPSGAYATSVLREFMRADQNG